jgi:hypothetical protein
MARRQGSELGEESSDAKAGRRTPGETSPRGRADAPEPPPVGIPEGLRRLIALGLSGVFATQENLRQVVGDALPKEWVDFVSGQSERTRAEFLERLAGELARSIESIDLARVMQQALEGRTLEVHARIRMLPDEPGSGGLRISMKEDDES